MRIVSDLKAAKILGIPNKNLTILEKRGLIQPIYGAEGRRFYSYREISRVRPPPRLTNISTRRVLALAGGGLVGYLLLVGVLITLITPESITDKQVPVAEEVVGLPETGTEAVPSPPPVADILSILNGLIIADNGSSTLSISDGKTFASGSTLTLLGTDGTTITFQGSDTYIGRATTDTLANKTIAAESNTISGLTDSNLADLAGISNSKLANSSVTISGNNSSGSVGLGGSLGFTGSGITEVIAAGSKLTFTSTEADTLRSVFERENLIPTTTGATANTIDEATIRIGNIASSDQQNFSTLNLTNGGSGFLDVELIRGFINFQGMNTLYDDFTSKSLDTADRWTSTSTGGGSTCTILAGGLNGLLRMDSGPGANRGCELTTHPIGTLTDGYYQRNNNPILETKLKIDTVTNARIFVGFSDTRIAVTAETNPSTHHAYIAKKAADTTWQCVTDDGGAIETITDTGITISANTFYRLRVELRNGTIPQTICTIDDGTTVTRIVTTATQPGATSPMDIYLRLNQSDTVAKNMDIDYVRTWQDDPPLMALTPDGNVLKTTASTNAGGSSGATLETDSQNRVAAKPENLSLSEENFIKNFLKNPIEFFGKLIFHAEVIFLGRPVFNKDTAGRVFIKAGSSEASVKFDRAYPQNPVVTASVNLVGDTPMNEVPGYAIYDLSTNGFRIKLSRVTTFDLSFSWVALSVGANSGPSNSLPNTPTITPTPEAQVITPTEIPSPTPETVPIPTTTESASPSASLQ